MISQKTSLIFLYMGLCLIMLNACDQIISNTGQGTTGANTETQPIPNLINYVETISVEAQELAKPKKVRAWVDGLIVTQQPGMKELEIAKMKAGEEADYMYQRTLRKVTRTLRGQNFTERYILITTKDGQLGWVHEGGVRYIRPAFENLVEQFLSPANANNRVRGNQVSPAQDFMVVPGKRVGPIVLATSEQDLLQIYGTGQVHRGFVATPDNPQTECTVVMPGTPNEIKIVYKDVNRSQIKEVHFLKEYSNWYTPEGLTSGLSFSEVLKANKAPISFYGFKWKYSGTSNSWGNGSLSRYNKKFYTVFTPRLPIAQVPSIFIGDKVINSNTSELDRLQIHVEKMVVYLD